MPQVSVRLVLFDIDGTLIRTGGAGVRAFARAAELLFGAGEETRNLRFHGRTDGSLVSEFLRCHGLTDDPVGRARFLDTYVFLLDEELHRSSGEVCPGVRELIAALSNLPEPPTLGLLTGNIRLGAALKLTAHGLADVFALGAFGDDHLDRNELARIALARGSAYLGQPLSGNEVVVIGDTRADIECARAIGARCVAVATGGESLPQLLEHSPAVALESMAGVSPGRILEPGRQEEKFVDWETLYRTGDTRWDHGEPAPALVDFLAEWPSAWERQGSVAVPGCGFGHDARAWAAAGFDVLGLDSSPTAIAGADALLEKAGKVTFRRGDFLSDSPPRAFDGLFEHTLFCAIPPQCRDAYVRAAQRWIRPGGYFFAVHYLQPESESGPPFAVSVGEILERFQAGFELVKHWVPRSFVSRQGRERAFLWIRKSK
ncbi:MAG: hypothetical protein RIS76_4569 [Verrucomicrobiota bacterium]|jgi:phosphoglycolate phosphatase-like HAD superfamily hydrolase